MMLEVPPQKEIQKGPQTRITIGNDCKLTLADVHHFVHHSKLTIHPSSFAVMENSHRFLKSLVDSRQPVYGVNTNFGDQVNLIDPHLTSASSQYENSINARQTNIIKSLACGLGPVVSQDVVKVTMMLRAHCLAKGYSAVNPHLVSVLLAFIDNDIIPVVRTYGSIGASGDLIPLAMIAASLIGENVAVSYQNKIMMAPQAMKLAGLTSFRPTLRDGLALINGTSFMTAIASLALYDLNRLFKQLLAAIAMSLESLLVIRTAYHPLVHQLKHHLGEITVNQFLTNFWQDSQLVMDLKNVTQSFSKPMQDYYSLRAIPQGFGPFAENLQQATTWIENEMNSINDNPIVDAEKKEIHHNANFMGYYVTDACDQLKMNIAQASTWLHALLANMVHPRKSHGLPTNIVEAPEQNNGFRSMQLLVAAITAQNRKLAQSQQAYTLPTEGDNQDVNSLGTHAAFDLKEAVANLERITAIIFLASAQALDFRGIEKASENARKIYQRLRQHSPHLTNCHPMSDEINNIVQLLKEEKI